MTEDKLAEIEARASSATPGPWLMEHDVWHPVIRQSQFDGFGPIVCREANGDSGLRWHPNADFISHAREDVPALVAEVRRLREALAAEREACAEVCDDLRSSVTWSGRGAGNVAWDNARHVCASAIRERGTS